jgi:CRP-like cAMP-binding protein
MIDENLLIAYGSAEVFVKKGEHLFHEKQKAKHYFQVKSGKIESTPKSVYVFN